MVGPQLHFWCDATHVVFLHGDIRVVANRDIGEGVLLNLAQSRRLRGGAHLRLSVGKRCGKKRGSSPKVDRLHESLPKTFLNVPRWQ